jgi:putative membrane protein
MAIFDIGTTHSNQRLETINAGSCTMSKLLFVGVAAIAALSLGACHKTGSNAGQDVAKPGDSAVVNTVQDVAAGPVGLASAATANTPEEYVKAAAMADMYEIEAGKIAVGRAKRSDVKMFGQMMIDMHTKTSNDLKAALKSNDIAITPPAALDDRRTGMLQNLRAAGDTDFDMAYLHQQLAAHLEALTLHGGYADHGDNAVLKAAAAKTKPVVQSHIDELKKIGGDALSEAKPG